MRRQKGVLLPPIHIKPIRRGDLYRALHAALLEGLFVPGGRLPSTREAALDYGVSRGLMEEVFAQLVEEGFLERAVGRGTFVTSTMTGLNGPAKQKPGSYRRPVTSRRGQAIAASAACREPPKPVAFNAGIPDAAQFPWKIWNRLNARAARELGHRGLNFADPRGLSTLRVAIARHLAQFRGIRCDQNQIIVFNSAQQALIALSILLLDRSDVVWIEDPGYPGARAAFELAGARTSPIPVDNQGLCIDVGLRAASHARLAYVTPSHQYPTGVALTLDRRLALLEWSARNGSWIVEDDYDGEFRYAGQPLASLHSLDTHGRVLYLGTLNKSMFLSLRLAYLVVPEDLVEPLANIRTQLDGFTPALTQMCMSLFMDEGYFPSHLRRMRAVYGNKRALLVDGLQPLAARDWSWSNNPVGMHLLIRHGKADYVRSVARRSSLDLALLSGYRISKAPEDGLFLRFGALDPASLTAGVEALVASARKLKQ